MFQITITDHRLDPPKSWVEEFKHEGTAFVVRNHYRSKGMQVTDPWQVPTEPEVVPFTNDDFLAALSDDDADAEISRFIDRTAEYDARKITDLRKIASQRGMVGAWKGPKKDEIVAWLVNDDRVRSA